VLPAFSLADARFNSPVDGVDVRSGWRRCSGIPRRPSARSGRRRC